MDLAHRARGLVAEAESGLTHEQVSDDVLVARVRSRLGRAVQHPSLIRTEAKQGRIIVTGEVLTDEVDALIESIVGVRGVSSVENRLDIYQHEEEMPGVMAMRSTPPPSSPRYH